MMHEITSCADCDFAICDECCPLKQPRDNSVALKETTENPSERDDCMRFIGIWFDKDREVKRDTVTAKTSDEASAKLHALYAGRKTPAPCLTVIPANGTYGDYTCTTSGGRF